MALIKNRLGIEPVIRSGDTGQFDVIADGKTIATRGGNWFTRRFGAGYPDFDSIVDQLDEQRTHQTEAP
ncbi:MAG TPA: hypothetical protein VFW94_20605 [Candidatus Acidoferrales bacterium]|nr:hypothetical protein [Candidatus Acidoferrales bacterium]